MNMESWYGKLGICLLPLALVPIFFFLTADGYLSFGGGEKDIILIFPMMIWAILYAIAFTGLWVKRNPVWRCAALAVAVATVPLVVTGAGLFMWTAFSY
ncbi:MAG: hypothetical protein EXQ56_13565 [Acidobacteria bacterium]|nr:hypothetical protein [Acidobacteriota bacterium]